MPKNPGWPTYKSRRNKRKRFV